MKDENKTKDQLISELAELRKRIGRLEGSETNGKRAATIQLESEEKLNLLVENIRDVLFELSPSGFIRYVSPNVKELYGYSPEELIGKHFKKITPTSEKSKAMKAVRRALSGKTIENFEISQINSEGGILPVEATITPVEKEGKVIAVHGLMRDTTERKRAEEKIKRHAAQFTTLHETSAAVSSRLTLEEIFQTVVCGLLEAFGYRLIGIYLIEGGVIELKAHVGYPLPPDPSLAHIPLEKGVIGRTARTGQPQLVTRVEEDPDFFYGAPGITSEVCVPLKRGDEVLGVLNVDSDRVDKALDASDLELLTILSNHIVIAIENARLYHAAQRDLAERRRAEDALRESNQTLLTVLNSIHADVYVSDLESYRVLFMNTHMQDNFGKDLVGKLCYKVFRGEKEPCAHCTNDRLLGPNGEPTGVVAWEDENPVTNRSYRNYDKAIKWTDGRFVRLQVATDITDLKQAEEEQKKLEAQLWQAQKVEALGTIAGGIAHNFNNILMAIQGNASLMLLDTDSTHPHYERLKSISRSVQSGSRLTGQLLGYARKGRYQVRTTNLNDLVRETSDTFGVAKKEIRVHRDLAEDLSMINADPEQIEQVLLNLYVNASDVMPRGGDLFLKTTNVTHKDMGDKPYGVKPGDYVLLTVRDSGSGMDKKTMERIFDPFFTTKGMGRGTGLGLASVYGIIKAHSGYIDVESKRGDGTTFSIYLPTSEKKVIEERQKRAEVLMGTGTVLLVDDEAMILDVGAQMLRTLGYKVLLARSGKEAIELYKTNKDDVDMVILDMVIPDSDGGETYDKMKEINSNVKVLLSSGYSVSGHPREILERGCDAFIQKPFDIKGLSQKISEILDTR
jgi:PAS domain S-box-containing protein